MLPLIWGMYIVEEGRHNGALAPACLRHNPGLGCNLSSRQITNYRSVPVPGDLFVWNRILNFWVRGTGRIWF